MKFGLNLFFYILLLMIWGESIGQRDAQITYFHTDVRMDKDYLVEEHTMHLQINHSRADDYSRISLPYHIGDKLEILEAKIVDAHGQVVRSIKKKDIQERNAISSVSFFDDRMVKEFQLQHHLYPYQIVCRFQYRYEKYISLVDWNPLSLYNLPVEESSLTVSLPEDFAFRQSFDSAFVYSKKIIDGETIQNWSMKDCYPIVKENWSPPASAIVPSVRITPIQFNYGEKGSLETWQTFGRWQYTLNQNRDELTLLEKRKVDDLVKGVTDPNQIIAILYKYLQKNTRYINVSIDIGGLQTHPASYVCENKYGDCKALTNYMQSILKYAGIQSSYVIIRAGDNISKIDTNMPSQQFNHVVLCVPMEDDTIWLENTSDISPPDYLGTFTQNRFGLLIDSDRSRLIKTPAMLIEDVTDEDRYILDIDLEKGICNTEIHNLLRGESFERYQYVRYNVNERGWKEIIEVNQLFPNINIHEYNFRELELKPELYLNAKGSLENHIRKVANMYAFNSPPLQVSLPEKPEDRTLSVQINFPIATVDTIQYRINNMENYSIELPEDAFIENKYGSFSEEYSATSNQIEVVRKFFLAAGEYDLSEYKLFYDFFDKMEKYINDAHIIARPK